MSWLKISNSIYLPVIVVRIWRKAIQSPQQNGYHGNCTKNSEPNLSTLNENKDKKLCDLLEPKLCKINASFRNYCSLNILLLTSGFKTERNLNTFVSRFFLRNNIEIPLWSKYGATKSITEKQRIKIKTAVNFVNNGIKLNNKICNIIHILKRAFFPLCSHC